MKHSNSSQTAYQHTNAPSASSTDEVHDHGWADAINRMIDQRYAFLALEYENNGYLFRGMSSGFIDALLENKFWHYSADDRGSNFEKELDILLMSQDFSDALTVSKLWEQKLDACILVFQSEVFNQALSEKNAAMMATAEPGVVFKYPFLVQPLSLDDIEYLIVSTDLLDAIGRQKKLSSFSDLRDSEFTRLTKLLSDLHASDKLITSESTKETDPRQRSSLEKGLMSALLKRGVVGSTTINTNLKPIRQS